MAKGEKTKPTLELFDSLDFPNLNRPNLVRGLSRERLDQPALRARTASGVMGQGILCNRLYVESRSDFSM